MFITHLDDKRLNFEDTAISVEFSKASLPNIDMGIEFEYFHKHLCDLSIMFKGDKIALILEAGDERKQIILKRKNY